MSLWPGRVAPLRAYLRKQPPPDRFHARIGEVAPAADMNAGRHFDELGWLEGRIIQTKAALGIG